MKIKNIEKAAERFKRAANDKEKIVLYGDADLDGTCSVIILEETLRKIGLPKLVAYFPDRSKEGYGLNLKALSFLEKEIKSKFLLTILDSGITNFKEIKEAEKRGIEVIVIDHHQPLDYLPEASLIVDPKQKEDNYPFKNFANTGIVFRLSEEILGQELSEEIKKSFLELVALATIADMMEQEQDNKFFIKEGLESLEKTKRLGLKALKNLFPEDITTRELAQRMISTINAGEVVDHKTESYNLLTCQKQKEARKIADTLLTKSKNKHQKVELMILEIENRISDSDPVVFESSREWDIPLLGTAASKICSKFKKPVFLLKKDEQNGRGAVRMPSGMNAVDVMSEYSELLQSFGGHPPAAGFNIKNENIEKFKKKLIKHFKDNSSFNN